LRGTFQHENFKFKNSVSFLGQQRTNVLSYFQS